MSILFLLTPKSDVAYIYDDFTLRQVLEKMEYHRYAAVPIITHKGKYVGTLTEGDLLWAVKDNFLLSVRDSEQLIVKDIERHNDNKALPISTDINDIIHTAIEQNFVPLVDDRGIFIGIITRKKIIQYFYDRFITLLNEDNDQDNIK